MTSRAFLSPLAFWLRSEEALEGFGYDLAVLSGYASRVPTPEEVVAAARRAGADPAILGELGAAAGAVDPERGMVVRGSRPGDLIAIAVELALTVGPMVAADAADMIPVVVLPGDTTEERRDWLRRREEDQRARNRQTVTVTSLTAYQWSMERHDAGVWEPVRLPDDGLAWVERGGLDLPESDPRRHRSPGPDDCAAVGLTGAYGEGGLRWTADGSRKGLGTVSSRRASRDSAWLGLDCDGALAAPAAALAISLSAGLGPLVLGRPGGQHVLVTPQSHADVVADLLGEG